MKFVGSMSPLDAAVSPQSISPTPAGSGIYSSGGSVPFIPPRAVLSGLDPVLKQELAAALGELSVEIVAREEPTADLIFCAPPSVESERRGNPRVPVIAVSRARNVAEWLDAMEAGAMDYCAAPFEPANLSWIVQSSARSSVCKAA